MTSPSGTPPPPPYTPPAVNPEGALSTLQNPAFDGPSTPPPHGTPPPTSAPFPLNLEGVLHGSSSLASATLPPTSAPLSSNPETASGALLDLVPHRVPSSPRPKGSRSNPVSVHSDDDSSQAVSVQVPLGKLDNVMVVVPVLTPEVLRNLVGPFNVTPLAAPAARASPAPSVSSVESLLAGLPPMPSDGFDNLSLKEIAQWYDAVANTRMETLEAKADLANAVGRLKAAKARHATAKRHEESTLAHARDVLSEYGVVLDPSPSPGPSNQRSSERVRIAPELSPRRVRKRKAQKMKPTMERKWKAARKVTGKGKRKASTPPPDDEEQDRGTPDDGAEGSDGSEYVD